MDRLRRMLRFSAEEVPTSREECLIEGPPLLMALRGIRPVRDIKSSLMAKLRLMRDLKRSALQGPDRS